MATDARDSTSPAAGNSGEPSISLAQGVVTAEAVTRVIKDAAESVQQSVIEQDNATTAALSEAVSRYIEPVLKIEQQYEEIYGKDYLHTNQYGKQETGPGATMPTSHQVAVRASETIEEFGTYEWYMEVMGTSSAWEYLDQPGRESAAKFMARMPEKEIENSWVQFGQLVDELTDGSYEVRDVATGQMTGGGSTSALGNNINPLTGYIRGSDNDAESMARYNQENPERFDIKRGGITLQQSDETQEELENMGVDPWRLGGDDTSETPDIDEAGLTSGDQGAGPSWDALDFVVEMTTEEAEKIDLILQIMEAAVELGRQQNDIDKMSEELSDIDTQMAQETTSTTGIPGIDRLRLENTRVFITDERNKANMIYEVSMNDFFDKIMNAASPRLEEQIIDELALAEP